MKHKGQAIKTTAKRPNKRPAQLVPIFLNIKVAKRGKAAPKADLKNELAAIAEAAKTKYASMI